MGQKIIFDVYLLNKSTQYGLDMELPSTTYELLDAMERLGATDCLEITTEVENCGAFGFLQPHLNEVDSLLELNKLAYQLADMDAHSRIAFEGLVGMAVQEHIQQNSGALTVAELHILSHNTDTCVVLCDVHDDAALGQFYVENDFLPELTNLPEKVSSMLDFAKIGKQMRKSESGIFTPGGYVLQTQELSMTLETAPLCKPAYMMRLTIRNNTGEPKTELLDLPASEERIRTVQEEFCIRVMDADCIVPQINEVLSGTVDIAQVNKLAKQLQILDEQGQIPKYKAVLQATHCEDIDMALVLTEALDDYQLKPEARSLEEFVRSELNMILCPDDAEHIYRHLDCGGYAREGLTRQNAEITPYGMVNRADFGPLNEPIMEQTETREPQMGM